MPKQCLFSFDSTLANQSYQPSTLVTWPSTHIHWFPRQLTLEKERKTNIQPLKTRVNNFFCCCYLLLWWNFQFSRSFLFYFHWNNSFFMSRCRISKRAFVKTGLNFLRSVLVDKKSENLWKYENFCEWSCVNMKFWWWVLKTLENQTKHE